VVAASANRPCITAWDRKHLSVTLMRFLWRWNHRVPRDGKCVNEILFWAPRSFETHHGVWKPIPVVDQNARSFCVMRWGP